MKIFGKVVVWSVFVFYVSMMTVYSVVEAVVKRSRTIAKEAKTWKKEVVETI